MPRYEVQLPDGLTLSVHLSDHPVRFSIHIPNGSEVKFDYAPWNSPRGSVTLSDGRKPQVKSRIKRGQNLLSVATPSGSAIEFFDPAGIDPMVPE